MLRGAHERKNTQLTIISILFVFFLLASFLFLVSFESWNDVSFGGLIILVYNKLTPRLGIRYWKMKHTKV